MVINPIVGVCILKGFPIKGDFDHPQDKELINPGNIPQSFQASQGCFGVIPSDFSTIRCGICGATKHGVSAPPGCTSWVAKRPTRPRGANIPMNPIGGDVDLYEVETLYTNHTSSLCLFSFFFFVLVDGVRCDFVEGYIFSHLCIFFWLTCFFFGLQWVAWDPGFLEEHETNLLSMSGASSVQLGPHSLLKVLVEGWTPNGHPKLPASFFHAFTNYELETICSH